VPLCGNSYVPDESMHEYRDVTPLAWGERFHNQDWVSRPVMSLICRTRRTHLTGAPHSIPGSV
jgi:hypothetical protein